MEYTPKVVFIDEPFKVQDLPLKDIYVLDNWLSTSLHHHYDTQITQGNLWSKTNQVNSDSSTGLPHHSFWGGTFFRERYEMDAETRIEDTFFTKYLDRRLQTEFGFKWVRFQYAGLNSQTQGLEGTTHADCKDEDEWNISFLYYPNRMWNDRWGGTLRLYDEMQQGLDGRDEHIKNHQIAEVEFKPNRLIMFDGRIPHGADAPNSSARYMDRRSLVIRGDEVRLTDNEENYYANDRLSYIR
jgi:hypothetical protein